MKHLGLDLGTKSLGIAFSDASGLIASAYQTFFFEEGAYHKALKYVLELIEKYKVDIIILGYPKNMDNTIGKQALISEAFYHKLKAKTKIEVILWDERLTTAIARQTMIETKTKRKEKKGKVDQIAATILLQDYLNKIRK